MFINGFIRSSLEVIPAKGCFLCGFQEEIILEIQLKAGNSVPWISESLKSFFNHSQYHGSFLKS
jgi:hypothetical protein